jgi:nucleoid DNA-binding protein
LASAHSRPGGRSTNRRNPATDAEIQIAAATTVKLTAGNAFNDVVNAWSR